MNYTNREVVRRLKQYDMFLSSLELATDDVQRERICDQLDKIEKQILLVTNSEYEEQYMSILEEESRYFSEEKEHLHKIISLILDRKKYLEDRKNKHKEVTGSIVELTTFLGEDMLSSFRRRLEIIEKYEENKTRQENLIKDMKNLDVRLSEASRIVKSNTRLNDILENKMREIVSKALDKLNLYSLINKKSDILKEYETYEYAFKMAKDNLKVAKKSGDEDKILECDEMLSEVASLYSSYEEKVNILKLIEIYDNSVTGYEEILEKREKINDILRNISDSSLYSEIANELNKQYNTIKLQGQDIENYQNLKDEREQKRRNLYEIEEENNSKEFKAVIDELLKNENRLREEQIRKAKKEEYQERQKKLLEEQKIEASRVRRQKLIEEAKLKEQQERIKKVKELQEKTVINPKKEDKVNLVKEEKVEIKVNPLKGKSYDEMLDLNDDFDSSELFENTKIVPNKVLNDKTVVPYNNDSIVKEVSKDILWETTDNVTEDIPVWEEVSNTEIVDLFKDESKEEEVAFDIDNKVEEEVVPEVEEKQEENRQPSIYDILENNENIIWKTTESNINKNTIPVIGNNNLKPELLDNRVVDSSSFPKLDNRKEADMLWKETL